MNDLLECERERRKMFLLHMQDGGKDGRESKWQYAHLNHRWKPQEYRMVGDDLGNARQVDVY